MSGNIAGTRPVSSRRSAEAALIAEVQTTTLPEPILELADAYDEQVGDRDRFLWKWIHNLFDAFTLPCVPAEHWETVREAKTVLTMYVTVLDDLADRYADGETFEQARRIPHAPEAVNPNAPGVDADVIAFAERLWDELTTRLDAAPCREAYADVFRFDTRQTLGAMEYSCVLNENRHLANLSESRHFGPYNMAMFPYADVDLMWSPSFDRDELGSVRSLLHELQEMARIGNWLTTWERELFEGDYTAGVVVESLERDIISLDDDPADAVDAIRDHDLNGQFDTEWSTRYADAIAGDHGIDSFDADELVRGMRTVMEHHIASYGRK